MGISGSRRENVQTATEGWRRVSHRPRSVVLLVLLLAPITLLPNDLPPGGPAAPSANLAPSQGFIANVDPLSQDGVRFHHDSRTMQVGFSNEGVLYRVRAPPNSRLMGPAGFGAEPPEGALIRTSFHGGSSVPPVGRGELEARAHYFVGADPGRWKPGVPMYAEVVYEDVWPGISVAYRSTPQGVKYAYEMGAGADPKGIALSYDGADRLEIVDGTFVASTAAGELRDSPPTAEQDGVSVACEFRLIDDTTVGLSCPAWNPARSGVIDPLVWVTYLGASGRDDLRSIAVDDAGSVYVVGHTGSMDFPVTAGAFNVTYGGGFFDVFVAKFRPGGDQLVWATYLGGSGEEYGLSIGVDAGGSVYVTGYTTSADFPTRAALDAEWNSTDAFVTKLSPSGDALVFSTFLGGTGEDAGQALAVGSDGSVFVVGITGSLDFPTTASAPNRTHNGGFFDGFVAKLDPTGASLAYATYLGGAQIESAVAVAIDAAGAAYVTGGTISPNFITTPGAYDRQYNDLGPIPLGDAYLTKVNALGTAYAFSTFLGGAAADAGWGVQVDGAGRAYVTGYTESSNFPTTPGAMNETYLGGGDAFVTAFSTMGAMLAQSTFLGGTGSDQAFALRLDALDHPYVAGITTSTDFPVTSDAPNGTSRGGRDAFLAYLNTTLDVLTFGTYFGGSGSDDLYALAIDPYGHAYLGGLTLSTDLPTTSGAFDRTCGTDGTCDFDGVQTYSDGFLGKIKVANPVTVNVTVTTIPPALQVMVDGIPYAAPYMFACALDSSHSVDAPSLQVAGSTRYLFDRWSDGGAQNHTFRCDADATIIGIFLTEYQIVVTTSPAGLALIVDTIPIVAPATYWWGDGSTHELDAPSPQGSGGTRRTFFLWSDGGARVHIATIGGPQSFVASFLTEHDVTVTADPLGLIVEVDGVSPLTPFQFWCVAGTFHTVNATSPQFSGPVRRTFRTWSDSGAQNHTFSCTAPAVYTAFFDTDYEVIVDTLPLLLEVIVDGLAFTAPQTFWCPSNTTLTLNAATPQGVGLTRYVFASWSDGFPRFHSVTCSAPLSFLGTFDTEHWVAIDTSPPGLLVTVDGTIGSAPQGFWWLEGSSHELNVSTPQFGNATSYTFATWLDDPAQVRTIVVTGPFRYVARFDVAYFVTFDTNLPGLQLLVDGVLVAAPFSAWWANGSSHSVSAPSPQIMSPGVRHLFIAWSDAGPQGRQVQVNGSISLTAAYRPQYQLALSSVYGTPRCDAPDCWYDPGDTAEFGIERYVGAAPGTRFAFQAWAWVGRADTFFENDTVLMDGPEFGAVRWGTEYLLRVDSAFGTTVGEGWHEEGTLVAFSVSPTEVVLASRRFAFRGWGGDVNVTTATSTILMNAPRHVTAIWEEPSDLWWFCLPLAVIPFPILYYVVRRKRRKEGSTPANGSQPSGRPEAFFTAVRTRIRPRR